MAELAAPQTGFVAWFKRKVLRRDETQIDAKVMNQAQGPISKEFQMFYQLVRNVMINKISLCLMNTCNL